MTKEERTQCPVEGYGGAGHFLMLGKSAELANEIRGFLEEVGHGASIAPWPAAYLEIIAPDSEQLVSLMLAMASACVYCLETKLAHSAHRKRGF